MSLEQQVAALVTASNNLTGMVAGKQADIDAKVAAKTAELDAWKSSVVEVINGVEVIKAGGLYQFKRSLHIETGGWPACNTTPSGPTYVQLLEFTAGAVEGSFFEINVHKAHRGMGYAGYYEYVELRGTYWYDGIGGIARKFSNGEDKISLYTSDATNVSNVIPLPLTGAPVPFAVKQIANDGNDKKYALMLVCNPECGADEFLGISVRYSDPHAKPAANFASLVKPTYPNL
ncbi:hypothetical protein [Chromobacterium sp. IIBBL 290-4]|uniref:hypothetical protein n=1 Tax=Chromobacterium sp. IIBBL 290-4 TaxID=2953890 RepID=UPI0020B6B736|nr:hypothetical protein [Chromobacterium sp. IIBBL 290-4]UTH76108.1 hypothetical protein NKT35_08400 [Chromobacterium sp. IIBBL 290-4]